MENNPFADIYNYYGQTTLHPLGLTAVILMGFVLMVVPRRFAVAPMLVMACFVSPAQRVVIFTLDFDLLRIMTLVGWSRILLKGECQKLNWRPTDYLMIAWSVTSTIAYTLQIGDSSAFINRLGTTLDALGMYFLFRHLMTDWSNVDRMIECTVFIAIPVAVAFLIENRTGRNLFAFLGGVPEITFVRNGKLRCQGAFAHSILAGCFWAVFLPMYVASFWKNDRSRWQAIIGIICALIIIVTCASSTPAAAVVFAIVGALFFPMRHSMSIFRWSLLGILTTLHLVMKAPVWHLISRIDIVGGSTGWHRYHLIDAAINNIGEWWLLGTTSTAHWGEGLFDVTNQYIFEGVQGGLLAMILFIAAMSFAYRDVGRLWRMNARDRPRMILSWALGVTLFVHTMNFIAVSYFGQIQMIWFMLLATITTLASQNTKAVVSRTPPRAVKSTKASTPRLRYATS